VEKKDSKGKGRKMVVQCSLESPASNLEQDANLPCTQANSFFYPQRDKRMSSSLQGEGPVWLIGVVVCLHAAPRLQLFISAGNGCPRDIMYCNCSTISSFQSVATSETVK